MERNQSAPCVGRVITSVSIERLLAIRVRTFRRSELLACTCDIQESS